MVSSSSFNKLSHDWNGQSSSSCASLGFKVALQAPRTLGSPRTDRGLWWEERDGMGWDGMGEGMRESCAEREIVSLGFLSLGFSFLFFSLAFLPYLFLLLLMI